MSFFLLASHAFTNFSYQFDPGVSGGFHIRVFCNRYTLGTRPSSERITPRRAHVKTGRRSYSRPRVVEIETQQVQLMYSNGRSHDQIAVATGRWSCIMPVQPSRWNCELP